MCGDGEKRNKFNFNLHLQGRNYVSGAYTDLQKVGSNTNGDFQVILPNNIPTGRYNVSVRQLQIFAFNEGASPYAVKLFLDTLGMSNGYNNQNQSNNQLYGTFKPTRFEYASGIYGNFVDYQEGGAKPMTQQVSGIQSLANGIIRVRITNEQDAVIAISGQANLQGNWFMVLDFEYLGE